MSDLSFSAQWDLETFKNQCELQRSIAAASPIVTKQRNRLGKYRWRLGPWRLCFVLETWVDPLWHGSVYVYEEVGYKTVDHKLRLEMPEDKALFTDDWTPRHFEQARFLLAEMFGPIIRPGKDQQVLESVALLGLHWHTRFEGSGTWQRIVTAV